MTRTRHNTTQGAGRVALVGAGPGDPDLLTLKAARLLGQADVVLYDHLVHDDILGLCPPSARKIFVGKIPGGQRTAQPEINRLLVEHARRADLVVRLKGGDPFVFGRGSEEALELVAHGIDYEVVPGISSCIAVPERALIPVTHRKITTHFSVVTGMASRGGELELRRTWFRLGQAGGTLVVLMGVGQLEEIVAALLEAGRLPDTPAALVQEGTTQGQRVVRATLATLAATARAHRIASPATIVIGEVVGLRDELRGVTQAARPQALLEDYVAAAVAVAG
ncbi:MAG: uroporphyrinogen-III C-methyltransferase [Myxococcota bacterium]